MFEKFAEANPSVPKQLPPLPRLPEFPRAHYLADPMIHQLPRTLVLANKNANAV